MATVTVAIPVYNGARHLRAALDCVCGQTFRDLEILVFDNASTDETPEIVRDYAARDPRIRVHTQPYNKGAVPNFREALDAATTPFFMWRAVDDLSSPDFVEVLHGLLVATPGADLAVCRVVAHRAEGGIESIHDLPAPTGDPWRDRRALLFGSNPCWCYGLYRREALVAVMRDLVPRYPGLWAWDYVLLFPFLFDRRIVGTDAIRFEFTHRPGPSWSAAERARVQQERFALRAPFLAAIRAHIAPRVHGPVQRALYGLVAFRYTNRAVLKFRKTLRCWLRQWLPRGG